LTNRVFLKALAKTHTFAVTGPITGEQIRDLAALQCAFLAVEAERRNAERETLHKEVQERTGALPSLP